MGIPTLGLFRDGKLIDRLVGYPGGAAPIKAWIEKNVPTEATESKATATN
jgi:thioredoxin-like negative regulator of GroEL